MQRKKLAIVSSYNTLCGNASYTHVLKNALALHYDVDVIAIDHKLMATAHPSARQARMTHLNEVASKLSAYDCVNIQFEAGLYGYSLADAARNIEKLILACRALLLTIHRVPSPGLPTPLWRTAIKNGRNFKETLRAIYNAHGNNAFKKVIRTLKLHKENGHVVAALVHTQREAGLLRLFYDFADVIDFPLTFLTQEQIAQSLADKAAIRERVFEKYDFDPLARYIGIFGFISENKGHHIAVEAMQYLSGDYKLAVFGSQHPMSIQEYDLASGMKNTQFFLQNNNPHYASLCKLASDCILSEGEAAKEAGRPLSLLQDQRVRFLGSLSDPDFIEAMLAMDFIILPYLETGQGGSGNASLALELETNVLFSRTHAFMELSRYYPDCFRLVDIGNPIEMAQAIEAWKGDYSAGQRRAKQVYCIENNALLHQALMEGGIQLGQKLKDDLVRRAGARG